MKPKPLFPLSASVVESTFAKLAGAVAGLTLLSLVAGHSAESSYLSQLGAPWAIKLVPPTSLVQSGSVWVLILAMTVWAGVASQVNDSKGVYPRRFYYCAVAGFVLHALLGISFLLSDLDWSRVSLIGDLERAILAEATAACAILACIGYKPFEKVAWRVLFIVVVTYNVLLGLMVAPASFSAHRATRDANVQTTRLSSVTSSALTNSWLLVGSVDSGLLVMSATAKVEERLFKIVNAESLEIKGQRARGFGKVP